MLEKPALYCRYITKGFNSSSKSYRSGAAPRSKTLGVLSNSRESSYFSSSSGSSSSKGRRSSSLYYDSSSQAPLPSL